MVLAPSLLSGMLPRTKSWLEYELITINHLGAKEEWSLVRSHPTERDFGIQLAGAKPALLARAAEVLTKELGGNGFQYANVNCGCPIDLVFQTGAGAAR